MAVSDSESGLCFRSLGALLKLLARDEIAPRRAAVMAYTCNLLLRTLPAIDRETHASEELDRVIVDLPRPQRDWPQQDLERAFYSSMANRHTPAATPVASGVSEEEASVTTDKSI